MNNLPSHIRKWWDVANDRRQRLIVKSHGEGLSLEQDNELALLQKVAEEIMEYDSRAIMVSRIPKV
jgi:hypothetical protein